MVLMQMPDTGKYNKNRRHPCAVSSGNIGIRVKVSAALRPDPGHQWRSEIRPRYPMRLFPLRLRSLQRFNMLMANAIP
jgi:hypothetical protein